MDEMFCMSLMKLVRIWHILFQLLKTPQNLKLIIVIVLQAAGNAVKRATEALVRAAQQVKDGWDQPDGDFMVNDRMVGGIAQVDTTVVF